MVLFLMVCNTGIFARGIKMQTLHGNNEAHVNGGIVALVHMGGTGITVHIVRSLQAES